LSRPVVVLRPEAGASATAERARALGLEPILIPLFEVEPVAWEAPDPARFDALLLTSANAVRAGGDQLEQLRGLPVHAVGEASADAARNAGFDIASTGAAGVDRLLESIEPGLRLLHLCGEDRREPTEARQRITPISVYRAAPNPAPNLSRLDGGIALVHSPRAGRRLAELLSARGRIAVAAISEAAAAAVGTGWQQVEVAEAPNDEALLALAARLCNKPDPQ